MRLVYVSKVVYYNTIKILYYETFSEKTCACFIPSVPLGSGSKKLLPHLADFGYSESEGIWVNPQNKKIYDENLF